MSSYSLINTSTGSITSLDTNGYWPTFILHDKSDTIPNNIKRYGHWELHLIDDAKKYIKDNTHVLDIGANIGAWTVYLAKNKTNKIHSFEPFLPNYYNLCSNILINDAMNVETYRCALGNADEYEKILPLYTLNENIGATRLGCINDKFNSSGFSCKLDYLDRIFKTEDVSFIKIDVEGYEEKVLRGGEQLIRRCKPTIYFESWNTMPQEQQSLFKYLESLGYTIQHIQCDDYRAVIL